MGKQRSGFGWCSRRSFLTEQRRNVEAKLELMRQLGRQENSNRTSRRSGIFVFKIGRSRALPMPSRSLVSGYFHTQFIENEAIDFLPPFVGGYASICVCCGTVSIVAVDAITGEIGSAGASTSTTCNSPVPVGRSSSATYCRAWVPSTRKHIGTRPSQCPHPHGSRAFAR